MLKDCCCMAGELDSPHAKAEAGAEEASNLALSTALLEKHLKSKLALAADHFNRSPSKGLDYFQVPQRVLCRMNLLAALRT